MNPCSRTHLRWYMVDMLIIHIIQTKAWNVSLFNQYLGLNSFDWDLSKCDFATTKNEDDKYHQINVVRRNLMILCPFYLSKQILKLIHENSNLTKTCHYEVDDSLALFFSRVCLFGASINQVHHVRNLHNWKQLSRQTFYLTFTCFVCFVPLEVKFLDMIPVFGITVKPLSLTPGFNVLGRDSRKTRGESFKFWNLVCLILEMIWYVQVEKYM